MACFATGITVVTTFNAEKEPVGLTVNSLTSVSLNPPLILFCVNHKAHIYTTFRQTKSMAINILSEAQENISQHFAYAKHHPKPDHLWVEPRTDAPLIQKALASMVVKPHAIHPSGDHDIFVCEVVGVKQSDPAANPLLYYRSRYRTFGG